MMGILENIYDYYKRFLWLDQICYIRQSMTRLDLL
jgi:hypothetical protein